MKKNDSKKILVIEDELIIANDIKTTLEEEGYDIVGIADSLESARALFDEFEPGLIICDINLRKRETGIDVARELIARKPVKLIFLTAYSDEKILQDALDLKPVNYLTKPFNDKQLLTAVRMAFYQYDKNAIERVENLSCREKEIAKLIIDGLSSKQIAVQLFISDNTVNTHRREIKKKLQIMNNSDWFEYKFYL